MKHFTPLLFACLLQAAVPATSSADDTYVYGKDGSLTVFPAECVLSISRTLETLTLSLVGDTVVTFAMSDVANLSTQAPELPTMTSFKLNNKFNPDLVRDVEPLFLDGIVPQYLELEVPVIGKRLTPSFKLSDENAVAYVDGEAQESKVSRLRFDKDITYTVSYPNWKIYNRTKLTDDIWSEVKEDGWVEVELTADMLSSNQESNLDYETTDKMIDNNEETYFQSRYGTGQLMECV